MRLIDGDKVNVVEYAGLVHIPPNDYLGLCAFFKKKLIDEQPTITLDNSSAQWISVEERLPEEDGRYLVAIKYGDGYSISTRKFKNGGFGYGNGVWERRTFGVRYWMPLPEPPEERSRQL